MMDNIRDPSSHIGRERKGKDSALEDLLEYWGAWRANVISGLSASSRSPITVAIELYKPVSVSLDSPSQPKQTRVTINQIPKYWPQKRMSLVNQAVWELQIKHQEMLIHRYEDNWSSLQFIKEYNWLIDTYYARMSEARRAISKHPTIKKLLHRG